MAHAGRGRPEIGVRSGERPLQGLLIGTVVVLVASPVAFILFAMSLMVAEVVMFPTATLVTAVITALVASWAAHGWVGDGNGADINTVIGRNLAWAIVPASISLFLTPFQIGPLIAPLAIAVLYTSIGATRLALRHRRPKRPIGSDLGVSAVWLVGTGLGVAFILFVASRFGLTGA